MRDIDWNAVLNRLKQKLRENMIIIEVCYQNDECNPYTFEILDLQERIGAIEQGNYEEAYNLLVEEFGEEYFDDFLLK